MVIIVNALTVIAVIIAGLSIGGLIVYGRIPLWPFRRLKFAKELAESGQFEWVKKSGDGWWEKDREYKDITQTTVQYSAPDGYSFNVTDGRLVYIDKNGMFLNFRDKYHYVKEIDTALVKGMRHLHPDRWII